MSITPGGIASSTDEILTLAISKLIMWTHNTSITIWVFNKNRPQSVPIRVGSLKGEYVGFDWFAASMFLLMRGSFEKTWDYLKMFSTLLVSGYLWTPRLHLSVRFLLKYESYVFYGITSGHILQGISKNLLQTW